MNFFVCWKTDLKDVYYAKCDSEECYGSYYAISAMNEDEACEKYLNYKYDKIYNYDCWDDEECEAWDEEIMKQFVFHIIEDYAIIESLSFYNKIKELCEEIYDRYIEMTILDKGLEIYVRGNQFSYIAPDNKKKYIDNLAEEYDKDKLLDFLDSKEKKEIFRAVNEYEVAIIEMRRID